MNKIELYSHSCSDYPAIEISIDTNKVGAIGSIYAPILSIPLELRLYRLQNKNQEMPVDYTLFQIGGSLHLAKNSEQLIHIPTEALVERTSDHDRVRHLHLSIMLDLKRIELMEKIRSGDDMGLLLKFWGVAVFDGEQNYLIEKFFTRQDFEFKVPQSVWVRNVVNKWKFTDLHLVEIYKSKMDTQAIPEKTLEHLKSAEKHFLHFNARETLASLYSAFEALAKQNGMKDPDKNFFSKLLSNLPNNMREKYRDLFSQYCNLLQLGRHEQKPQSESGDSVFVDQKDAQLALILGQTILGYISKVSASE